MSRFKTRVRCALLGMLLALSLAPMLAIASGIIITDGGPSGEFYDPTRSGEGFFIEVAKVGDAIVFVVGMFTYDLDGNLMWITGSVVLEEGATVAVVTMFIADPGTMWGPDFDADEIELPVWGTMVFNFPTCDTMVVLYTSPKFGTGAFTDDRITNLVGVECEEKEPIEPPPGGGPSSGITAGTWTGAGICFHVAPDGNSLTPVGSGCDNGFALDLNVEGIEPDRSKGVGGAEDCRVDLETHDVIPIVDGAFVFATGESATLGVFGPQGDNAAGYAIESTAFEGCIAVWEATPD